MIRNLILVAGATLVFTLTSCGTLTEGINKRTEQLNQQAEHNRRMTIELEQSMALADAMFKLKANHPDQAKVIGDAYLVMLKDIQQGKTAGVTNVSTTYYVNLLKYHCEGLDNDQHCN